MDKAKRDTSPSNRGQQHGDLAASFDMIADMWNVYLRHKARAAGLSDQLIVPVDAVDVLEMMSLLKKARNVYGAPLPDHTADDIGYTGLAGGLRLQQSIDQRVQDEVAKMMAVQNPEPSKVEDTEELQSAVKEDAQIPAFLRAVKTEA